MLILLIRMLQTKVRRLEIFEDVRHNYSPYGGETVEEDVAL